jgi:predicted neutral ceramidase superfamily lipid hydrolase
MKTFSYEFDGVDFDYDVDYGTIHDILVELFMKDYGLCLTTAKNIIDDLELWEILEEIHEEYLYDLFEDDARNAFEDSREYEKDPYSYYGVSRNDF